MMIEQHYDEEVLAEFLGEPNESVSRDKHLASCDFCLRTLDSLRSTARVLRQPAVWDKTPLSTAPRPQTLAFLRGMQKSMVDEDALAAVWIKQLLAGPRETWAPRLEQHPEWRTGGMVRRLNAAAETMVSKVPEEAVAIAALGVQIAEASARGEISTAVGRVAALSYYHRGYALWYTGNVIEALADCDRADVTLGAFAGADLDCARVSLMRAMIYQMLERRDEALHLATEAANVFAGYEDVDRVAAARSVIAITLQEAHREREALLIHAQIVAMSGISERWRLSAVNNMALCYQAMGDLQEATDHLVRAIAGYEKIGMMTFRSKSRWALADVFAQQGKHEEALALYRELRTEFQELGMWNDVALASLDAADVLAAVGRTPEIREICRTAIEYFVANGLERTEPALRGLAYLQEAVTAESATSRAIQNVRAFLLAPESGPDLLFAEPLQ
jgi:tetratricopeptide (TPR) repeat protein